MSDVERTKLPGVGDRRDFVTQAGERIGVVTHRDGRRELLVYRREDPDSCYVVAELSDDDVRHLVELFDPS